MLLIGNYSLQRRPRLYCNIVPQATPQIITDYNASAAAANKLREAIADKTAAELGDALTIKNRQRKELQQMKLNAFT